MGNHGLISTLWSSSAVNSWPQPTKKSVQALTCSTTLWALPVRINKTSTWLKNCNAASTSSRLIRPSWTRTRRTTAVHLDFRKENLFMRGMRIQNTRECKMCSSIRTDSKSKLFNWSTGWIRTKRTKSRSQINLFLNQLKRILWTGSSQMNNNLQFITVRTGRITVWLQLV